MPDWIQVYTNLKSAAHLVWGNDEGLNGGEPYPITPVDFAANIMLSWSEAIIGKSGELERIADKVSLRVGYTRLNRLISRDWSTYWRKALDGTYIFELDDTRTFWDTIRSISITLQQSNIEPPDLQGFVAKDIVDNWWPNVKTGLNAFTETAGDATGRAIAVVSVAAGKGAGAGIAGFWDELPDAKWIVAGGGIYFLGRYTGAF